MLKKYAQRLLNPDSNTEGNGGDSNVAIADNSQQQESPLKALASIDEEIRSFNGDGKFPSYDTDETENKKQGDAETETAKVTDKKEVKPVTNVRDFAKVLPEADDTAKKLGDNSKSTTKAADGDEANNSQLDNTNNNNTTAEKQKRDYSGFSEQEVKVLKRMSNEAFEYVAPKIKEYKSLEAKLVETKTNYEKEVAELLKGKVTIPENYYENPQAVYLTPEVQEYQQTIQLASSIENHWKQQLLNIEMGKEWYDLIEDPKTGQIFVSNKATNSGTLGSDEWVKNKYAINDYYTKAQRQTLDVQQQLNTYVANFKQRSEGLINNIKAAEDQYMPMFKDPKSEDYKTVEIASNEITKLGISKSNPAFTILAKSIALNLMLRDTIMEIGRQQNKQQTIAKQQREAGPTQSSFSGGASKTVAKAPTLDDFAALGLR